MKKYDLNNDVVSTFSNNGWTNCGILKLALEQIYMYTKGKDAVLLLDSFPAHKDKFISNEAQKLNIQLIFVPEGLTYKYQPLDVSINGIIKQKSKKKWKTEVTKNPDLKITSKDAVIHFMNAFKNIKCQTVKKSFYISCFNHD